MKCFLCLLLSALSLNAQFLFNGTNVNCAPTISGQPANITRLTNTSAPFSVTAAGPFVTYRWRTNGVTVGNGIDASGATTAAFILSNTPFAMSGLTADCVVSNVCSSLTSSVATLTITNGVPGGGGGPATNIWITDMSSIGNFDLHADFDGERGTLITLPTGINITIRSLGRWKVSGNSQTHTLKVYSGDGRALIGTIPVDLSSGSAAAFKYSLTNIVLFADTGYYLLSTESNGGDSWYLNPAPDATSGILSAFANGTWDTGSGFQNGTANRVHVPVNFTYSVEGDPLFDRATQDCLSSISTNTYTIPTLSYMRISGKVNFSAWPTFEQTFLQIRNGTERVGSLAMGGTSSGDQGRVTAYNGTVGAAKTSALTISTDYYFRLLWSVGTGANGLAVIDFSTTPTFPGGFQQATTSGDATTAATTLEFTWPASTGSPAFCIDSIIITR